MKTTFERLQDAESQTTKLANILHVLKHIDYRNYNENYAELSTDAALRAERITCQLRKLVYGADLTEKNKYMAHAAETHGITITSTDGILIITAPCLLPKRKIRTNTNFLFEPLNSAMQEYQQTHEQPLYQDCVVCFTQIYDRTLSGYRVRDYDNLEFKQLLDTIAPYVLVDDSSLYCDTYHTAELGDHACTMIHIMEKAVFPKWVIESHKKHLKYISEKI